MSNSGPQRPIAFPGGLADPAGRVGYVANATGGIDALDLDSGEARWSTEAASRPLLALDDRLVCQAFVKGRKNALQVVVLDAATGGVLLRSEAAILPDWVDVTATGESFRWSVRLEGDTLVYRWEAQARYRGGAPPPPEVLARATKDAAGVARISLSTGRIQVEPGEAGGEPSREEEAAVPVAIPQMESEAMDARIVGSRAFYLLDSPSGRVLKARDACSGAPLWERPLGPRPVSKPPRLRP